MGLQKEIEQLFRSVVELDLERISRSAEPSYHWPTTPPVSMFGYPKASGAPGSVDVSLVPQDYQVVRIELNPFRINPAELGVNLDTIKERRQKRGVEPTEFERKMNAAATASPDAKPELYHEAYHLYIEETEAKNPIPIVPRHLKIENNNEVMEPIISVAGVDYVLDFFLGSSEEYAKVKDKLHHAAVANRDQWPEEVVLLPEGPDADQSQRRTYVRADVSYWENGQLIEHRLAPSLTKGQQGK